MRDSFMSQGFLPRAHTMIPDSDLHNNADFKEPNDLGATILRNNQFLESAKSGLLGDRDENTGLHKGNGIIGRMQTQQANDSYLQKQQNNLDNWKAERDRAIMNSRNNIEMLSFAKEQEDIKKASGYSDADAAIEAYNTQLQSMGFNSLHHFNDVVSQVKAGTIPVGTPRYTQIMTLLKNNDKFVNSALEMYSAIQNYERRATNPLTQQDRINLAKEGLQSGLYQNVNQALTDLANRDKANFDSLDAQAQSQGKAHTLYSEAGFFNTRGGSPKNIRGGDANFLGSSTATNKTSTNTQTADETNEFLAPAPNADTDDLTNINLNNVVLDPALAGTYKYLPEKLNQTSGALQYEEHKWANPQTYLGGLLNTINGSNIGFTNDYSLFSPNSSRVSISKNVDRLLDNIAIKYNKSKHDSQSFFDTLIDFNKNPQLKDNYGIMSQLTNLSDKLNTYENGLGKQLSELAKQGKLPDNPQEAGQAIIDILKTTKDVRNNLKDTELKIQNTNNEEAIKDFKMYKEAIDKELDRVEKEYKPILNIYKNNNPEFLEASKQQTQQQQTNVFSSSQTGKQMMKELATSEGGNPKDAQAFGKAIDRLYNGKGLTLTDEMLTNNPKDKNPMPTLAGSTIQQLNAASQEKAKYFSENKNKKIRALTPETTAILALCRDMLETSAYQRIEEQILTNIEKDDTLSKNGGITKGELDEANKKNIGAGELAKRFGKLFEGKGNIVYKNNKEADYTSFVNMLRNTVTEFVKYSQYEKNDANMYNLLYFVMPEEARKATMNINRNQ